MSGVFAKGCPPAIAMRCHRSHELWRALVAMGLLTTNPTVTRDLVARTLLLVGWIVMETPVSIIMNILIAREMEDLAPDGATIGALSPGIRIWIMLRTQLVVNAAAVPC